MTVVETALLLQLREPGPRARVHCHRPAGAWLVTALHGRAVQPDSVQPDSVQPDSVQPDSVQPDSVQSEAGGVAPAAAGESPATDAHAPATAADATAVDASAVDASAAGSSAVGPELTRARLLEEGAGWLDTAVELERGLAQLAGARVRALASFARCRPGSWDRQPGERGAASKASRAGRPAALTEVSEWAVAEVAARLRLSASAASGLLVAAVELVEQLPGTLAALEAGTISWPQAQALVELLRPVRAEKKAAVEARVLPRAPRQTVAQLRECTRRAIARIDAQAALRRLREAIRGRKVTRHPAEDGMAVLTAVLPGPVARACWEALRAYAQACAVDEDGRPDPRSLDERMADCLADLILRPEGVSDRLCRSCGPDLR